MKAKTHSWAKKRVKITGTWKFVFDKCAKRHLLKKKSKQAKSKNPYGTISSSANVRELRQSLPNGL